MRPFLITAVLAVPAIAGASPASKIASPIARPVVTFGAGAEGFLSPDLRDAVDDGQTWTARISAGGHHSVRIELAYAVQRVNP